MLIAVSVRVVRPGSLRINAAGVYTTRDLLVVSEPMGFLVMIFSAVTVHRSNDNDVEQPFPTTGRAHPDNTARQYARTGPPVP